MTILRYNLFRARQLMSWRLRVSDKTIQKFAELPIYCQRQKCSPGNVVSGSIRFVQIFAGVRCKGASNESVVVENGDFYFFRSLSSEHFTYMATPHDSFHVMRLSMILAIFQGHLTVSHQISQERCVIRQKLL